METQEELPHHPLLQSYPPYNNHMFPYENWKLFRVSAFLFKMSMQGFGGFRRE